MQGKEQRCRSGNDATSPSREPAGDLENQSSNMRVPSECVGSHLSVCLQLRVDVLVGVLMGQDHRLQHLETKSRAQQWLSRGSPNRRNDTKQRRLLCNAQQCTTELTQREKHNWCMRITGIHPNNRCHVLNATFTPFKAKPSCPAHPAHRGHHSRSTASCGFWQCQCTWQRRCWKVPGMWPHSSTHTRK